MFLGLDIGTSGVKAAMVDENGLTVAQQSVELAVSRPSPLWSEQNPDDWWSACDTAVQLLDPDLRRQVRGIGLTGQMHGATLLGENGRPLRPAILWDDGRSFAECEELDRTVPDLQRLTGNVAMPGFTAPKLNWVRRHEPEIFHRVRTVLLPKDFVRFCMTGEKASDLSDSAGTLWLDVGRRTWSEEMLHACGLSIEQMPRLFEGTEVTGVLRLSVATRWGMGRVPVVAGGGDNAASAAGVGVVHGGDALLSLGTSGVIFAATEKFRANASGGVHAFCHCVPGMWHQMTVHLSAAVCVDWIARLIGADGPEGVVDLAQRNDPAGGPELFLPYLSGERTPHNDPHVRGAFLGLDHNTTRQRLAGAVLEGVAFALADGLSALREAGTISDSLSVVGGGARSPYWGRLLSAALNVHLHYLDGAEIGAARGAAQLARIGVDRADVASVCIPPPVQAVLSPDPILRERLVEKMDRFRGAYRKITPKEFA